MDNTENWSDKEWKTYAKWLRGLLDTTVVNVTFIKKDGATRIMKCTLKPELLPEVVLNEEKIPRRQSSSTMAVYDLDADGWRSFTLTSITSIEFSIK